MVEQLSLLRGKGLKITDDITIKHPTLGEIEDIGYDIYSLYLSIITTRSYDIADILWVKSKVWFEDIKNEWLFFIQRSTSEDANYSVKTFDSDNKLKFVEQGCAFLTAECSNALNFFLGTSGGYVVLKSNKDDNWVLCNVSRDEFSENVYCIHPNSFKITEHSFYVMQDFLIKINNVSPPSLDARKGGGRKAKEYILRQAYKSRSSKNNKSLITLESIISSIIAVQQSFSEVWNYPIYTLYNLYYRLNKINHYNETVHALHSGAIDTKKNKIDWDKINWASIIK